MRVVTLVGSRAGEVVTLAVPAARAMLADGRARLPEDTPADEPGPAVLARVAARVDRGLPRTKPRRGR